MAGETWRCPGCRDTTNPMGMCPKCGVFGLRYEEPVDPEGLREWAMSPFTTLDATRTVTAGEVIEALAAAPVPLDVERLARALRTVFDIYGWDTDEMAVNIAREYAQSEEADRG